MNQLEKKLKKEASLLKLSDGEKRSMRLALENHMRLNQPLGFKSPWSIWMLSRRVAVPALAILVICAGTAGTAYAAQGALPGDLLYPVKIHVDEPVEVALAVTPAAKAKVQAQLASRRVAEAQTLADRGALDAATTQELQDSFNAHAAEAISLAEKTESPRAAATSSAATSTAFAPSAEVGSTATSTETEKEKPDLTARLKTSLDAQAGVLEALKLRIELQANSRQKEKDNPILFAQPPRHERTQADEKQRAGSGSSVKTDEQAQAIATTTTASTTTILPPPASSTATSSATTTASSSDSVKSSGDEREPGSGKGESVPSIMDIFSVPHL